MTQFGAFIAYFFGALCIMIALSAFIGYRSGRTDFGAQGTATLEAYLVEQFQLGLEDFAAGNLELARQRFEYVYLHDSSNQAAADKWVEISLILNTTATTTPPSAGPTATPTVDPRPVEELFTAALNAIQGRRWDEALDILAALRKANPQHRTVNVDGMIFTALRNRGVDKILNRGELEGGLYDFAQAEFFQPLDRDALIYQGWARLYLQGKAFYGAYPEIAASYFGQLAGVIPGLRDDTGRTAWFLYWSSLVQIGDLLAADENWCEASDAYTVALNTGNDATVASTAQAVQELCFVLTPTVTSTPTWTTTVSATATLGGLSATPTATIGGASATPTNTPGGATATPTTTPTAGGATDTPTFTATFTFTPTFTATPTVTP
jgi:hypothetical protein